MEYFLPALKAVAVSVGVGLIGFWVLYRRVLPHTAIQVLSALALDVALPCQIFVSLLGGMDPSAAGWWRLPLWWVGFTVGAGLLTALAAPLFRRERRRECALSLFYQNAVFVPLIMINDMFGPQSPHLVNLFLFTMFFSAFFFNTQALFFAGRSRPFRWRRVLTPVFVATVLALALRLGGAGDRMPGFVVSSVAMVGDMAAPALLLLLGAVIHLDWRQREARFPWELVKFVILKNVVFPLVALGALALTRPPREVAFLIALQAAMPPLTALPLTAEREGGDRGFVNSLMLASFVAAVATVPLTLALFHRLFGPG